MSDSDDDLMDDDFDSDEELNFNDDATTPVSKRGPALTSRRQLERHRELHELRRMLDDPYLELD